MVFSTSNRYKQLQNMLNPDNIWANVIRYENTMTLIISSANVLLLIAYRKLLVAVYFYRIRVKGKQKPTSL